MQVLEFVLLVHVVTIVVEVFVMQQNTKPFFAIYVGADMVYWHQEKIWAQEKRKSLIKEGKKVKIKQVEWI